MFKLIQYFSDINFLTFKLCKLSMYPLDKYTSLANYFRVPHCCGPCGSHSPYLGMEGWGYEDAMVPKFIIWFLYYTPSHI